ncbi:MAG: hypothetical protein VW397_02970 [Candidatus Margulisiibacteriota bacterium]|jgi:hypothetical protein
MQKRTTIYSALVIILILFNVYQIYNFKQTKIHEVQKKCQQQTSEFNSFFDMVDGYNQCPKNSVAIHFDASKEWSRLVSWR